MLVLVECITFGASLSKLFSLTFASFGVLVISDLQVSPIFVGSILEGKNDVWLPEGSSLQVLSSGACS